MRVCRKSGRKPNIPAIFYMTDDCSEYWRKLVVLEGVPHGEWREFVWKLPPAKRPLQWQEYGDEEWRVRFRPQEPGKYSCRVEVHDANGVRYSTPVHFEVAAAEHDGYVRVSGKDCRYLAFDSGEPFFPVGINLRGVDLRDYDHYAGRLAKHSGNFIRIFLTQEFLGLETKMTGPIRHDQTRAARLDELVHFCEANGVYMMLALADTREVESGIFGSPAGFFTDKEAIRAFKAKLRYLVARYGHSPNIALWEFFNEVNGLYDSDGWLSLRIIPLMTSPVPSFQRNSATFGRTSNRSPTTTVFTPPSFPRTGKL